MLNPETLTILDPACGSGHILVEAYDILKDIYLERGYRLRDIPRLILEKNIFGLDIDDRAAQLAGFALLMKARADDRRILDNPPKLNILSLQSSENINLPLLWHHLNLYNKSKLGTTSSLFEEPQLDLTNALESNQYSMVQDIVILFEQAKTFGALIQIPRDYAEAIAELLAQCQQLAVDGDNLQKNAATSLMPFLEQAKVLTMQFDVVVANPPYMGGKYLNPLLKDYLKKNYKGFEKDFFSAFMIRNLEFSKETSQLGFMTPFVWMFISSYENLRNTFINEATITSLIQPEYHAFFDSAFVPVCAFTTTATHLSHYNSSFIQLTQFTSADEQAPKTLEAIKNPSCGWFYNAKPDDFQKISGSPVAYWASLKAIEAFEFGDSLGKFMPIKQGMATSDNGKFLRLWFEVPQHNIAFDCQSMEESESRSEKWYPYNKGGNFRKWYGNNDFVVNWLHNGSELKEYQATLNQGWTARLKSRDFYFKESLTWSFISSSFFGVRRSDAGFIFDVSGSSAFPTLKELNFYAGYLCSTVAFHLINILNPTLNFQVENVSALPILKNKMPLIIPMVNEIVEKVIQFSREDWDNYETSWDFTDNPVIRQKQPTLKAAFEQWQTQNRAAIVEMKRLEEENNRLFIEAYGLQDELSPDVPEEQITLVRADREKDSQRLISYAIGCMMGRYSLDEAGLIYAGGSTSSPRTESLSTLHPEPFALSLSKGEGNAHHERSFDNTVHPELGACRTVEGGGSTSSPRTVDYDSVRPEREAVEGQNGIIPITDEFWFEGDAAQRLNEFLQTAWGTESLETNKAWLAESLGQKNNETADETLRRYLANNFYKDHLQTYKKRPIYWLFSSGKQGAFQALVYLHRYNDSTLAKMRNNYVVPLLGKLQNRLEMLEKDRDAATSPASKNKIGKDIERFNKKKFELSAFDEKLRHYADLKIQLDLDDGVKVNYGKFGDLLAEVKAVTGGASDE